VAAETVTTAAEGFGDWAVDKPSADTDTP